MFHILLNMHDYAILHIVPIMYAILLCLNFPD